MIKTRYDPTGGDGGAALELMCGWHIGDGQIGTRCTLLHISLDPLFGGRGSKREFLTGALVDRARHRRRGRPSMYL